MGTLQDLTLLIARYVNAHRRGHMLPFAISLQALQLVNGVDQLPN